VVVLRKVVRTAGREGEKSEGQENPPMCQE
jgi:hypothetical protein